MGGAILLGTCLSGLQGLRGPLGWVPAEAAGNNNVVSKAAGVDIAYRAARNKISDITNSRTLLISTIKITDINNWNINNSNS